MSYLIAIKGKYGIVLTSDSYSTFPNRTLKDGNYKKISELVKDVCYIGITGMNEVLYHDKLVDINTVLPNYFKDITEQNINDKIEIFNMFLKNTCDKYCADISYILIYKNVLFDVSILNNDIIIKNIVPFYEYGIFVLGENMYKKWSINHIDENVVFEDINNVARSSVHWVKEVIRIENSLFPEGQRVVGGTIQQVILPNKILTDEQLGRKIV